MHLSKVFACLSAICYRLSATGYLLYLLAANVISHRESRDAHLPSCARRHLHIIILPSTSVSVCTPNVRLRPLL